MTEAEWRACGHIRAMLNVLRQSYDVPGHEKQSRKFRLFACACARRVWDSRGDDAHRAAVVVAERFADRQVTTEELEQARRSVHGTARKTLLLSGRMAANDVSGPFSSDPVLPAVLRDIFPFTPTPIDPRWRTADVVGLARGIYEERGFDRLPILADAFMDAGCDGEGVLSHCRSDSPHARGCWLIDGLLGKS